MTDEARIVVNFRMLRSLKDRAERLAKLDRRTLSSWLELTIEQAVEAAEREKHKPRK